MITATDTVIKINEENRRKPLQEKLLNQAEISFKAGERKVAEWVKEHSTMFIAGQDIALYAGNEIKGDTSYYPIIKWLDWQEFLRSEGIE